MVAPVVRAETAETAIAKGNHGEIERAAVSIPIDPSAADLPHQTAMDSARSEVEITRGAQVLLDAVGAAVAAADPTPRLLDDHPDSKT